MTISEIKAMLEVAREYDRQADEWQRNKVSGIAHNCRSTASAIRRSIRAALEVKEPEPTEWLSERLAYGNDLPPEEAKRLADNRADASDRQLKAAYDKGFIDGQRDKMWY